MSIAVRSTDPSPATGARRSYLWPFLGFSLAALLFYGAIFVVGPYSHESGGLLGPDSYMQIIRLREFIGAGDWYYNGIARANAPYGDVSHWTKPYELLLLLTASGFRPFMDTGASSFWAGIVIAPILHVVLSLAVAWASAPLIGVARFWVVPLILLNFPVIQQAMPGRADHHLFLVVLFAIGIGFALRMIVEPRHWSHAAAAGAAQGLALWSSVEFIFLAAITMTFGAVWWIVAAEPATRKRIARLYSVYSVFLIAVVLAALLAEYRPAEIATPALDRISVVYALFSVLAGIGWLALDRAGSPNTCQTRAGRTAAATIVAAAAAIGMGLVFPDFFKGPYADVSPTVNDLFLRHVREVRSIFDLTVPSALAYYGASIVAVPILAWLVATRRDLPTRTAWIFLLACATLYTALALFQLRFVTAASALGAIPVALLLHLLRQYSRDCLSAVTGAAFRVAVTFILLLSGGFLTASIPEAAANGRSRPYVCPITEIAPTLNAMPGEHTVFTPDLFAGPAILFHTRHSVVGTPYHRNRAGIEDTYRIMAATKDGTVRDLVATRGIDLILICKKTPLSELSAAVARSDTFYTRLKQGKPPAWLRQIQLPPSLTETFDLYTLEPAS